MMELKKFEAPTLAEALQVIKRELGLDVPKGLAQAEAEGLPIEPMRTSFFLGRETLVPSVHPRMMIWRENIFIMMMRLAQSAPDFFNIPADRVIEVGTKVEI